MTEAHDVLSLGETIVRCPIHDEPMRMVSDRTSWNGAYEYSTVRFLCEKVGCDTEVTLTGRYDVGMTPVQASAHASRKAAQRAEESGLAASVSRERVHTAQAVVAVTLEDVSWRLRKGEEAMIPYLDS